MCQHITLDKKTNMDHLDEAKEACLELFTEHPRQAGESYCEHFRFAGVTSLKLLSLGVVSLVHGLCPFLCTSTVSHYVPILGDELRERRESVQRPSSEPTNSIDLNTAVPQVPIASSSSRSLTQTEPSDTVRIRKASALETE